MQRIKKNSVRVLALLLSLIMLIGMLPFSALTAFATETGEDEIHTITYTSNNMEKFSKLFEAVDADGYDYIYLANHMKKQSGVYTYDLLKWTGSGYQNGYTTYSSYEVLNALIDDPDIESYTLTYNGESYTIAAKQLERLKNNERLSFVSGENNAAIALQVYRDESIMPGAYLIYLKIQGLPFLDDVTFSFNYNNGTVPPISVWSTEPEKASVGCVAAGETGKYIVFTDPMLGWHVDHWEYSFNRTDFFAIDGSEGKTSLTVTPTDETDYRAVIKQYSWCNAMLTVSVLNRNGVTFDGYLTDSNNTLYTENHQKATDSYVMDMTGIIDYGNSVSVQLLNISEPDDIKAVVVTVAGQTWVLDHVFDQVRSELITIAWGNSFMNWKNSIVIYGLKQELARQLTAENGIDIKIIYEDPNASCNVTALTSDPAKGSVPGAIAIDGQYLLVAVPAEGYALDYWEYAEGSNATEGFQKLEGSDGKANLMVSMDKDMTYRAIFISTDQKAIDFISTEVGIREMVYINEPKHVMLNNHPDPVPVPLTVNDSQSFFLTNGSLKLVDLAQSGPKSSTVIAGNGAQLWFTFRYYKVPKDITVKIYAGEQVEESKLLKTVTADELSEKESNLSDKKGTAICYIPVAGMPFTDQVTVVFTANGITAQKTLPLETTVSESSIETEKIAATKNIVQLYENLMEGLKTKSITYTYSSEYLMLKEELAIGLKEVSEAETEQAIFEAEQKVLTYLNDTANGLYHHGVDACISINNTMYIARVPQIDNVFTAMTAALEQAYPNGHWYYTVGSGAFGIFFGHAGYVKDPTTHSYGVDYNSSFASATYGVSDYFGREVPGMTNGLSNQCVWNGISTNTPTHFDATGAPENAITIQRSSTTYILAWDMARLRQHYSDEELLSNAFYTAALDELTEQSGSADALDKALHIEYADFFLLEETQATCDVVRAIGALTEQSSQDDVNAARDAYNSLSDTEKRGVFNYSDLIPLLQLKEDERTALEIDLKINNIGTVEYTDDCRGGIEEARNAYDSANANAQKLVTNVDILTSAEKTFAVLAEEKKAAFVDAVKNIPSTITDPDSKNAIDTAQSAWEVLLTEEQNTLTDEKAILDKVQRDFENAKAEYYSSRLDGALDRVLNYIDKTVTNPQVGSVGGEWAVLAQARAGVEKEQYYESYYKTVAEYVAGIGSDKLDERQSTDNSRVILALSSIGKKATNVGGYDLTAPYADFNWVKKQGINGVIFALLALDSGDYEIPVNSEVSNQTTREKLIKAILDAELENGGWSYSGETADPDMTAMALQALAPYCEQKDVKQAVDRALLVLSKLQNADGSFGSDTAGSGANVESTSQVIIALLTLGINPAEDVRFTKGGANAFTAILPYQLENGSFEHEIGNGADQMATEQAAMALTAYKRFLNNESALYVMTDKEQTVDPFVPEKRNIVLTDINNTGVTVTGSSDILSDKMQLEVNILDSGDKYNNLKNTLDDGKFTLYDMYLLKNYAEIQPGGTVTVSIPVPDGYDGTKCKVYCLDNNGKVVEMNAELKDGKLVFDTTYIGTYAVWQSVSIDNNQANGNQNINSGNDNKQDVSSNKPNGNGSKKSPMTGNDSTGFVCFGFGIVFLSAVVLAASKRRKSDIESKA